MQQGQCQVQVNNTRCTQISNESFLLTCGHSFCDSHLIQIWAKCKDLVTAQKLTPQKFICCVQHSVNLSQEQIQKLEQLAIQNQVEPQNKIEEIQNSPFYQEAIEKRLKQVEQESRQKQIEVEDKLQQMQKQQVLIAQQQEYITQLQKANNSQRETFTEDLINQKEINKQLFQKQKKQENQNKSLQQQLEEFQKNSKTQIEKLEEQIKEKLMKIKQLEQISHQNNKQENIQKEQKQEQNSNKQTSQSSEYRPNCGINYLEENFRLNELCTKMGNTIKQKDNEIQQLKASINYLNNQPQQLQIENKKLEFQCQQYQFIANQMEAENKKNQNEFISLINKQEADLNFLKQQNSQLMQMLNQQQNNSNLQFQNQNQSTEYQSETVSVYQLCNQQNCEEQKQENIFNLKGCHHRFCQKHLIQHILKQTFGFVIINQDEFNNKKIKCLANECNNMLDRYKYQQIFSQQQWQTYQLFSKLRKTSIKFKNSVCQRCNKPSQLFFLNLCKCYQNQICLECVKQQYQGGKIQNCQKCQNIIKYEQLQLVKLLYHSEQSITFSEPISTQIIQICIQCRQDASIETNCNHFICKSCLHQQFETQFKKQQADQKDFICLLCGTILTDQFLKSQMNEQQQKQLQQMRTPPFKNVQCGYGSCQNLSKIPSNYEGVPYCQQCSQFFCNKCKKNKHGSSQCNPDDVSKALEDYNK